MMLKTNADQLVEIAVAGTISPPTFRRPGYIPDNDGLSRVLPGMSGVLFDIRVGDPAFGWAGDHVEPGASIAHADLQADFALHYLSCIGNRAVVTSGEAAGAEGVVTGEHARILVDFEEGARDLLCVGDTIQIRALGRGLELEDYPHIHLKKLSPQLLAALPIEAVDERTVRVPVAMELPIEAMASGAELNAEYVDQDLASGDRALMAELGLDRMRLGDLIAIRHADHRFGRGYREGAVTIALCIHGDSVMTGHGPGILDADDQLGALHRMDRRPRRQHRPLPGHPGVPVNSNRDRLVRLSVMGHIATPRFPGLPAEPYRLDADGAPFLLPTYGSIVYNVSVGDSAYGWLADTVHPGVSIALPDDNGNRGLTILSCIGNAAVAMSGAAKGARGVVTGKSGRFAEQVIVHFPKADREKMAIGDKIQVRGYGIGLELPDHPNVQVKSASPELLEALDPQTQPDGSLAVPVVATVPAHLLGAGAGLDSEGGSIHVQTADREALAAAGLGDLRLGDVVALENYDSRYSYGYMRDAVGIGVVGQGDSPRAGYGPGLTLIMTATGGAVAPVVTPGTNLKTLLSLED